MENEGQRILFEAMGALEVAFTDSFAEKTDRNHIFLNFLPKITVDPLKIAGYCAIGCDCAHHAFSILR